jgi:hypothetical protein
MSGRISGAGRETDTPNGAFLLLRDKFEKTKNVVFSGVLHKEKPTDSVENFR